MSVTPKPGHSFPRPAPSDLYKLLLSGLNPLFPVSRNNLSQLSSPFRSYAILHQSLHSGTPSPLSLPLSHTASKIAALPLHHLKTTCTITTRPFTRRFLTPPATKKAEIRLKRSAMRTASSPEQLALAQQTSECGGWRKEQLATMAIGIVAGHGRWWRTNIRALRQCDNEAHYGTSVTSQTHGVFDFWAPRLASRCIILDRRSFLCVSRVVPIIWVASFGFDFICSDYVTFRSIYLILAKLFSKWNKTASCFKKRKKPNYSANEEVRIFHTFLPW